MHTAKKLIALPDTPIGKYEALFDQAFDAIIALHEDGSIDSVNQAAEEMSGYMRSELVGKNARVLEPAASKFPKASRNKNLSASLFSAPGTYEDVVISGKDGLSKVVDVSVRIVSGHGERLVLATFRDITEKKRMERELLTKHAELRDAYVELEKKNVELETMQQTLVQAGKMAALGELAAGIAHELNQPLQGIRGYAQELQQIVVATPEITSGLSEIISNSDKMASIIGYLRAFTRKSVEKHEMVDIHLPIEEAFKMLSRQFASRGIRVTRDFGTQIPQVYANPLQLEQVFINLATNARDAIEATERGAGSVSISTRVNGEFVEIIFKDDGCGMSDRTQAKAFNPFFTTKEVGKGMGLGLSLSYGMISKLHGSIVVQSEIGKGTTFLIRLPIDFRELA